MSSQARGRMFAGLTVALVTPFRDGEVDFAELGRSVDWQIAQGTPSVSPVGTTGESPTLTHDEHEKVIAFVVERVAGRAKVLAGTGSNATAEAVRLTKFAAKAGADGALLVSPYYNRPTQDGLYAHYARVADSVDLPQVLYNVPGRTGRNIEPETVERLSRHPNVVAIKEAAGSLDQVSDILSRCDLSVLSGDDSLTVPMMSVGAIGVVSVVGNLVPKDVIAMVDAVDRNDWVEARRRHLKLFPLCRDLLSIAANPIPVKLAMAMLGRGNGEMRLPLCPPDDRGLDALKRSLARYGLLDHAG
ncbi:MAG: dihydrodipicolinate synthase [Planctomycetota bacterium]|nr:dihydrodipicolinate synthase [Planctomycetota bacterium]